MECNFAKSLSLVLQHEGGYTNHPRDPGHATNRGVTQAVYDEWRDARQLVKRSVRFIDPVEVEGIYRKRYWDEIEGDRLPDGVDYCIFDFAVNSGVNRASRFLQRVLGVVADGRIGPMTLSALIKLDKDAIAGPVGVIDQVCDLRLGFLQSLSTFDTFGRGWTRRVEEVRKRAKELAA